MASRLLSALWRFIARHPARVVLTGLSASLVAVVVVGATMVDDYLNGDGPRRLVALAVEEATGRTAAINGKLHLKWSRSPVLVAEDVVFGNAPWGKAPHIAAMKRFEMEIALDPLRRGKVEIKRLVFVEPEIDLEVTRDGKTNWTVVRAENFGHAEPLPAEVGPRTLAALRKSAAEFAAGGATGAATATSAVESVKDGLGGLLDWKFSGLNIDKVTIENGRIRYLDGASGQTYVMTMKRVSADGVKERGPIRLSAIDGVIEDLPVKGRLTANPLGRGAALLSDMDLTIDGRAVAGSTKAALASAGTELALSVMDLTVDGRAVKGALRLATQTEKGVSAFRGIDVVVDGMPVKGAATLTLGGARPRLDGDLWTRELDLGALGLVDMAPQTDAKGADVLAFSDTPIDFSWMSMADGALKLAVDTFVTRDALRLENARIDLTAKDGRIDVNSLTARLADGDVAIRASLSRDDTVGLVVASDIKIRRLDGGKLFDQAGLRGVLTGGRTDAEITLTMRGRSRHELVSSLNGQVLLAMGEGSVRKESVRLDGADHFMEAFRNVNAAGNLMNAGSGREVSLAVGGVKLLSELFQAVDPMGEKDKPTALQCAVVHVGLKDGVLISDNGIAVESDAKTFVVKGGVDFKTERIDLTVRPEKGGPFGIGSGPLVDPIRIGGTLRNPEAGINGQSVAATVLSIGAAFATGGMSIMAETVAGFMLSDNNPCQTALQGRAEG